MAKRDILAGQIDLPRNCAVRHFDPKYHDSLGDPEQELLLKCINPGLVVGNSADGCVLFNPDDFYKLQPYFTKVMADLHQCTRELHRNVNPLATATVRCKNSDHDLEKLQVGPSLVRIRLTRNLGAHAFTTCMTRDERVTLEEVVLPRHILLPDTRPPKRN
jgi:hypothetical protein